MADVSQSVVVSSTPDEVWALIGDPVKVGDWLPMIAESRMEGDLRIASIAGREGEIKERIVEHSDADRHYSYEVVDGPMKLESYLSKLSVSAEGAGSRVLWEADFEPPAGLDKDEVGKAIDATYRSGLKSLRDVLGD